jgi:hypothetical protein
VTVTPASKEHPVTSTTRITPEKVGRMATKVAAETAYVVTGLADVLAGTVQDVVKQGKTTYTDRKAAGGSPVKDYARQVPGQMRSLAGEVKEAYESLSARGRIVLKDGFSNTAHRPVTLPEQQGSGDYEQPPVS